MYEEVGRGEGGRRRRDQEQGKTSCKRSPALSEINTQDCFLANAETSLNHISFVAEGKVARSSSAHLTRKEWAIPLRGNFTTGREEALELEQEDADEKDQGRSCRIWKSFVDIYEISLSLTRKSTVGARSTERQKTEDCDAKKTRRWSTKKTPAMTSTLLQWQRARSLGRASTFDLSM
eukprot:390539-Hanusia_phi.AAC.1